MMPRPVAGETIEDCPDPRQMPGPIRVVVHGLKNFCTKLPPFLQSEGWEIRHHGTTGARALAELAMGLSRADLAYIWGGRLTLGKFLWAARAFRKKKVIMFWSGTDVIYGQQEFAAGQLHPWIAGKVHWAGAPWLAEEVRSMGLACEYVPSTWVRPVKGPLSLPDKFSVLVYLPAPDRTELYGIDQVLQVARSLTNIRFILTGLPEGRVPDSPPNVEYVGWVTDMSALYRESTVVWRPARHDGLSFMAMEALGHGRHVLWTYPFEACVHATNVEQATAELRRMQSMHHAKTLQLNSAGIDLIRREFTPERIKNSILSRWREVIQPVEISRHAAAKQNNGTKVRGLS